MFFDEGDLILNCKLSFSETVEELSDIDGCEDEIANNELDDNTCDEEIEVREFLEEDMHYLKNIQKINIIYVVYSYTENYLNISESSSYPVVDSGKG